MHPESRKPRLILSLASGSVLTNVSHTLGGSLAIIPYWELAFFMSPLKAFLLCRKEYQLFGGREMVGEQKETSRLPSDEDARLMWGTSTFESLLPKWLFWERGPDSRTLSSPVSGSASSKYRCIYTSKYKGNDDL